MKILHTPARFYPYIGGVENTVYCLGKELVKSGHKVKVVCAAEPPAGDGLIDGVEVRRLPYPFKIANTNITAGLHRALMGEDFDVLHTHLPCPWSADISRLCAAARRKPLFLSYHNDITGSGLNKLIASLYNASALRLLLKSAGRIFVANGQYLEFSPFLKPWSKKVVVNPFGVDTERFSPGPKQETGESRVFFLSKLDAFHRYKGLEYLLSAMREVKRALPASLYIGGDGELRRHYEGLAREYGVDAVFLGALDDQEVVRQYRACDVFVLPSVSQKQEGFGLVALEAMACAKPVVITRIVGVSGPVSQKRAGIVIEPRNPGSLASALIDLLSSSQLREEMGDNAYALVRESYTWGRYARIVLDEYVRA